MTDSTRRRPTFRPAPRLIESRFGHPRGLFVLSGTQLWERLSFYGLQGILLYYIYYSVADGGLGLDQSLALGIVGTYGGAVYLLEPIGAWIADRVLAPRYVVLLGGLLIMAGHITLATAPGLSGLLLGLGLLVMGTGFLTPNLITMVGNLYKSTPLKRDAGFALFYGFIMVGALVGPIITGMLQTRISFHTAFGGAAIGMAIGLGLYIYGMNSFPMSTRVVPHPLGARARSILLASVVLSAALVAILISSSVITLSNIDSVILLTAFLAIVAYFVAMLSSPATTRDERLRIRAYIPILMSSIVFWILVLQLFTTFAVYADTRVNMTIGNFSVPPAYISTFEVGAGIVFSTTTSYIWQKLGRAQPNTLMKMALGLSIMALAFTIFALIPLVTTGLVSIWPVILGMFVFGLAEVMYAPIAYSVTTQCAPNAFPAQMMALYGLSMAAGASLSGMVGQFYARTSNESWFFGLCAAGTLCTVVMLFLCRPLFNKAGLNS